MEMLIKLSDDFLIVGSSEVIILITYLNFIAFNSTLAVFQVCFCSISYCKLILQHILKLRLSCIAKCCKVFVKRKIQTSISQNFGLFTNVANAKC